MQLQRITDPYIAQFPQLNFKNNPTRLGKGKEDGGREGGGAEKRRRCFVGRRGLMGKPMAGRGMKKIKASRRAGMAGAYTAPAPTKVGAGRREEG